MQFMLVTVVVAAFYAASSQGLQCYEGFNISIGGIPFFHGTERECSVKSKCFSHELETRVFDTKVKVLARYNGCISSAYSSLVTCENLFGPKSNLDPAVLFNMLPDLEEKFHNLIKDFQHNMTTQQLQELFSNGKGTESFIAGCYTFLENIGFNMKKARPLQNQLVELFKLIFNPPIHYGYSNMPGYGYGQQYQSPEPLLEVQNILQALKDLDTEDSAIAENIYSFLGNFLSEDRIKFLRESIYAPLVEKLPGLVKSIFPETWKIDSWYDFTFEIMGNLNVDAPKKSAFDVINTIKKVARIQDEYNKFLDPIMDSAPDLVEKMFQGDTNYALKWSLQLLKAESMTNDVTKRLSAALEKLYALITRQKPDGGVHMFITWIPGLYYNLFEGKKTEIDKAYAIIAKGIEAMDFQNPSATLERTKMSEFFIMLANKTRFIYPMGPTDMRFLLEPSVEPPTSGNDHNSPSFIYEDRPLYYSYNEYESSSDPEYESVFSNTNSYSNYPSIPQHESSSDLEYESPNFPSTPKYEYESSSDPEREEPLYSDYPYESWMPSALPNYEYVDPHSIPLGRMLPGQKKMKAVNNLVIINLSRVVYSLLPDFEVELDAIFTRLIEALLTWPADAGKIIEKIFIDVGWKIPPEIEPVLDHLQAVLNTTYSLEGRNFWNFRIREFRREVLKIIDEYEVKYPRSKMPQAVRGCLELVYKVLTEMPNPSKCNDMMMNFSYEQVDWNAYNLCYDRYFKREVEFLQEVQEESNNVFIDLLFAIFKEMDYNSDVIFQNLIDAFPDFAVYIRLMRALDASDVKALVKDYNDWIFDSIPTRDAYSDHSGGTTRPILRPSPTPLTITTFVKALDASVARVTSKLGDVTKELRALAAPESCKFDLCQDDLCNRPEKLADETNALNDTNATEILQRARKPPVSKTNVIKALESTPGGSDTAIASSATPEPTDQGAGASSNVLISTNGTTEAAQTNNSTTSGSERIRSEFSILLPLFWAIKKLI